MNKTPNNKSKLSETDRPVVLVVDDHAAARQSVVDVLSMSGYEAEACSSGAEALNRLSHREYSVVVTDLQMPGMSGLDLIREIERRRFNVQVLMVTAHASIGTAVEAMQLGAFDYLEKPYDVDRLENSVRRAIERGELQANDAIVSENQSNSRTASEGQSTSPAPAGGSSTVGHSTAGVSKAGPCMIGSSPAMQQLRSQLTRIAAADETVLICGESGVGKELVAQTIHSLSPRNAAPLVSLNCPVLSEQLTESELFGHCRGAFTGADADRTGRFEMAEGGSLLLDEITEINLGLQAKLLRVLQERSFEKVGSSKTQKTDVRVIATTNRDLNEEITGGRFREDLYYRIAVVPVQVPPLRDREEDVLELAEYFLTQAAKRQSREALVLDGSARELLLAHHWPGNVRELHNVITRACVLAEGPSITANLIRNWLRQDKTVSIAAETEAAATDDSTTNSPQMILPMGKSLAEMEREMILATLAEFDGHRAKTAQALGIGVRTLSGKLRDYGIAPREKNFKRVA